MPFFVLLRILSQSAINQALREPDRIKLRLEDTIDNIIFPKIVVGQILLYIVYQASKIYILVVIFRYYFQTRGINSFLKNKIIRNRFMLSLMIIVYELPFTMLISRDAIMMILYGRIGSWTNFTESFVYKEYDSLTIVPRIVYMTQGFFIPLFCLTEPQVKKHL